jgi:hypothetical protein
VLAEGHPVGVHDPGHVGVSRKTVAQGQCGTHGKVAAADDGINDLRKCSMYITRRRTESNS